MPKRRPSKVTISPARSCRISDSENGVVRWYSAICASIPVFDAAVRADAGAGAAGRPALRVDRDGVLCDVGVRGLDVDRECGDVATEPHRAEAAGVDGV